MALATQVNRRTQAERREEAESKLIEAAVQLIAAKGHDGFSLADVGDLAGYSRGLPGHYFGSKAELQRRVAQHIVDQYLRAAAQQIQSERGLPYIAAQIRHYVKFPKGKAVRALLFLNTQAQIEPELRATMLGLRDAAIDILEAEIELGIANGTIRNDIDKRAQAGLIYAFLRGQLSFATLDEDYNSVELGEGFIRNLVAGIGT